VKYQLTQNPSLSTSQCLVLGIFSQDKLSDFAQSLDQKQNGLISKLSKKIKEAGDFVWQTDIQDCSLLLIQFGQKEKYTSASLKKRISDITEALIKQKIQSATLCIPPLLEYTANNQLEHMLIQIDNQCYQMLDFKKNSPNPYALKEIIFYLPDATENALEAGQAITQGMKLTRDLANLPANICTPTFLGEQAKQLAKQFTPITCHVMGPEKMRKLGMEALLAVAQGSEQPPRFIEIHYKGAGNEAPIVLVGKGITFDSGGLCIKPGEWMDEMKYDMSGAASVFGAIKACALLKLPVNIVGLIASAENMISGAAVKPGDVITSMSGQTIEILNTDAEGRLVLADALTYAKRFNPQFVLDIATLTGGIIVALGCVASGFMTQDNELAQLIEEAAQQCKDRVWRMPLDDEYQDALDSPLADMINAQFDRTASSITAACFLSRFTKTYRWAHLDIAGTAWIFGKKRNATGRPVPLLTQLIRHVANSR
jgi:leucyl aminopeptidase